jgi:feruloyl esterase
MMLKRARTVLCTVALALSVSALSAQAHAADAGNACQNLTAPNVPGALVQSISGALVAAGTDPDLGGTPIPDVPAHCAVTLYLT